MGWTAPRTWVAGEIVTAALMNTHVKDNLSYLKGLAGAITLDDNIVFSASETVDGIDISGHGSATAYAGHGNSIGGHTHQSAGAQGGQIDHGLAITGLTDDDHTNYVLKATLTTRGDIFRRGTATVERYALGSSGYYLKSDGTDALWAAGVSTKEFFVPVHFYYVNASVIQSDNAYAGVRMDAAAEVVHFTFKAPHDFTSLTHCKVIGRKATSGNIDWTVTTKFAAIGEASDTHSDTDTGDDLAMTDTEIEEVDISAAFTGLAADDFVGVVFTIDAIDGDYDVIGLVFKYA